MKHWKIITAVIFIVSLAIGVTTNKPYQEPHPATVCDYFTGIDPVTLAITPAKLKCIPAAQAADLRKTPDYSGTR